MRKEVVKFGNSHYLRLSPEDLRVYGLHIGTIIDLTITKVEVKEDETN